MSNGWNELREECLNCKKCRLSETRIHVVFGTGNEKAEILFIGEGPGQHEDEEGMPFVGRSGQLMDKMLEYIGLSRKSNIYIANMVKCRPPQNRDPLPDEVDCCMNYLKEQIRLLNPKIIVCVGRVAAMSLIDKDYKVTKEHGSWIQKDGIWMMGTFHPAALLRNPNNKPAAMEDFFGLREKMKKLGLSI